MNIVLEGPDNSGKSELAKLLSTELGKKVFASEGPEKHTGELRERVERYRGLHDVIFDRHPCVSDIIYGAFRERRSSMQGEQEALFYASQPLLIYCDPLDRGLRGHVEKAHDSAEHIKLVQQRYHSILSLYRAWGVQRAHIVYRIGDDPHRIVKFCRDFDPVADVEAFHKRFNRGYEGPPRMLPADLASFRYKGMREELEDEYIKRADKLDVLVEDMGEFGAAPADVDRATRLLNDMLDSLVDLTYFTIGTARLHGFNFREAWRRVHEANMRKKAAERRSESTRGSALDIVKPEGWVAPSHVDLVQDHIHR